MSKSIVFSNDFLKLIFNSIPIEGLADDAAVDRVTALAVALHTADPTDQSSFEVSYTGYERMLVPRNPDGWTVIDEEVFPTDNIDFAQSTGGVTEVATHVSIGTGVANKLLYKGPLVPPLSIVADAPAPRVTTETVISEG